jgi:hypothetical protein
MTMTALATLPIADSAAFAGWTIVAVLTFLLIGLPTIALLALTLSTSDEEMERQYRNIAQYIELKERADAYAAGKDVYGVLDKTLVLTPLNPVDNVKRRDGDVSAAERGRDHRRATDRPSVRSMRPAPSLAAAKRASGRA